MKTNQQRGQHRVLGTSTSITLAAIILLGCAQGARAQTQWTTAPNGNDIYKTNATGNVGIGTTGPTYKLDVQGARSMPLAGFVLPEIVRSPGHRSEVMTQIHCEWRALFRPQTRIPITPTTMRR